MRKIIDKHKSHWADKKFVWSVCTGLLLLFMSLVASHFAVTYATAHESNYVTDLVLSNIPTYDVDWIFAFSPIIILVFVLVILFFEPKRIPFVAKSIAIFWLIRSIFITLTHIGPFPVRSEVFDGLFFRMISTGSVSDLFFSGHTGVPFLLSLIFWDNKKLRWTFLLTSVFLAVVVLLGHLHYSIDVFAAFFITYSIFALSKKLFARDYELFHNGIKNRKSE